MRSALTFGAICSVTILLTITPFATVAAEYPVVKDELHLELSPGVGVETEAEIGSSMIQMARYRAVTTPAIRLLEPVRSKIRMGVTLLLPAGLYKFVGQDGRGEFYQSVDGMQAISLGVTIPQVGGVFVPADRTAQPKPYYDNIVGHDISKHGDLKTGPSDPIVQHIGEASLRREFIYSGVSKGTIKLSYREFINDMARPSFTQELTYDLAEGDEIGFRGARFRVLKATNTSIRYVVTKPLIEP
ncbi:hypothetical protein [Phenylobacterium sp.]|uniref:hypothetical protein n=1 Tax=Phenylobacterium sp. TaxID=1871053 RepID=UPI00271E34F3|nr:hypothetical protein [Phenylobacterium sp.]MDO8798955.1 hypothetical protein [Phenylobacterium sp.]